MLLRRIKTAKERERRIGSSRASRKENPEPVLASARRNHIAIRHIHKQVVIGRGVGDSTILGIKSEGTQPRLWQGQVQPAAEQIQIDRLMAEELDRVLGLQHPRERRQLALAPTQGMEPSIVDAYAQRLDNVERWDVGGVQAGVNNCRVVFIVGDRCLDRRA